MLLGFASNDIHGAYGEFCNGIDRQRCAAASDLKGIRDSGRKPANNKNAPSFERGVRNLAGPNYTLNDDPQPQVLFTLGLSNLKPAPSRLST